MIQIYSLIVLEVRSLIIKMLGAVGENLFLCCFHLLEAACILWLVAPSSISKVSSVASSNLFLSFYSHITFSSLTFMPPSSKDPCDYIGSPG